MINLSKLDGFEWDSGNFTKNWRKHKVDYKEGEEVFNNFPLLILLDDKHSSTEKRYHALGQADNKRCLFLAFTIRKNKIRIISARDANKKEKNIYENAKKTIKKITKI